MSATIDERVVEMKFDNKEFETNVKQSLSTLEKLKLALKFDKGYSDSLDEINKATKNVSFDGMSTALDEVKNKFSALEVIGITALVNITNQVMRTGQQMVKSLSTDQITAGFDKYAQKTQSVQTIVNATGKSMEEVSDILQKLNVYTDETSYNFVDMVNNIGKFTSNQIPLEKAEIAMEGIANWAAVSGANATEASRAMYNVSQAMSAGYMKLIDWKSIQNANMATAEFKQTALETAASLGTLRKESDGTFTSIKGHTVTVKNFDQTLSDAWFTADVMMATFDKYGGFADKLLEASDDLDLSATKMIAYVDQYKKGTLDIESIAKSSGKTADELKVIFDELSDDTFELGRKSFKAAQEAKTFQEAIDSVKDAVSTGWMQTFELIFGNYEEAKALWTGLANLMYDVFATGVNNRNDLLKEWNSKELNGRKDLLDAFANTLLAIMKLLEPIKKAWEDVFPPMTAKRLKDITGNLAEFTSHLAISERTSNDLYIIFKGLFWVLKQVMSVVKVLAKTFIPPILVAIRVSVVLLVRLIAMVAEFARNIKNIIDPMTILAKVLDVAKTAGYLLLAGLYLLGTELAKIARTIKNMPLLAPVFKTASKVLETVINLLSKIPKINLSTIPEMFKKMKQSFSEFADRIRNSTVVRVTLGAIGLAIDKLGPKFTFLINSSKKIVLALKDLGLAFINGFKIGNFSDFISMVIEKFESFKSKVEEFIQNTGLFQAIFGKDGIDFKKIKDGFLELIQTVSAFAKEVGPAKIAAIAMSVAFLGLAGSIAKFTNVASYTLGGISGFFTTLSRSIKNIGSKSQWLMNLAIVIGTTAVSLKMLSEIPFENLKNAAIVLGLFAGGLILLAGGLNIISTLLLHKKFGFSKVATEFDSMAKMLIVLSASAALLMSSFRLLNDLNMEGMLIKVAAIGLIMLELATVTTIFGDLAPKFKLGSLTILLVSLAVKQVISALAILNDLDLSLTDKNLILLLGIMASIGLFANGIGSIGITSAVGILMLVGVINQIVPLLKEIGNTDFGELGKRVESVMSVFSGIFSSFIDLLVEISGHGKRIQNFVNDNPLIAGLGGLLAVVTVASALLNSVGKAVKKMGIGMIAMSAALFLASFTFEQFNKMNISDDAFAKAMGFMIGFMALITVYTAVAGALNKVEKGEKQAKITGPIIAMGLFFAELAGVMYLMTKVVSSNAEEVIWEAIGVVAAISACMTVLIAATASAKDVHMGTIMSLMVGMTFIFAEVAVFSALGWDELKSGIAAAALVTAMIAVLILAIGGAAKMAGSANGQVKSLIGLMGIIGLLALSIFAISKYGGSWQQIAAAAGGMTVMFIALGVALGAFYKMTKGSTLDGIILRAEALVTASKSFIAIAASLTLLREYDLANLGVAVAALGVLFGGLVGLMIFTLKKVTTEKMVERFSGIANALLVASVSFVPIAFALSLLNGYDIPTLAASTGALAALFVELAAVIGILTKLIGDKAFEAIAIAAALAIASLSFVAIAKSLSMLASLDLDKLKWAAISLGAIFAELSIALGVITAVVAAFNGIGVVAVLAVAVAFVAMGASLALAGVAMLAAAKAIEIGLAALENLVTFVQTQLTPELATNVAQSLINLSEGLKAIAISGIYLIGGAIGIGAAAIAFLGMSYAIKQLREVTGDSDEGLKTIASGMISLKESSDGMIVAGVAFGIAAIGLIAMSAPLLLLSTIDVTSIALSIGMLGLNAQLLSNVGLGLVISAVGLAAVGVALIPMAIGLTAVGVALKIANPQLDQFVSICGRMANGVISLAKTIVSAISTIINNITAMANKIKNAGQDAVRGLTSGVSSLLPKAKTSGGSLATEFLAGFKAVSGWHSPWDQTDDAGKDSVTGLTGGVDSFLSKAKKSGEGLANTFLSGLTSNLSSGIKDIKSKLNLDSIFGGLGSLGGASELAKKGFDILGFSLDDVEKKVEEVTESMGLGEDALASFGAAAGSSGGSSGPFSGLADTIKGAISVFEEFDRTVDISAEQMISNLDSQLNGLIEWKNGLLNLVEKGISPELYEYLANMGQKEGYGYVMALQNASQEQIADLNQKWAQYLTMPQSTANEIASGYSIAGAKAGQAIVDKVASTVTSSDSVNQVADSVSDLANESGNEVGGDFTSGMGEGMVNAGFDAYAELAQTMIESALRAAFDSHSPARTMYPVGEDLTAGIGTGMADSIATAQIKGAAIAISIWALAQANAAFASSKFVSTGRLVSSGIATGIDNGKVNISTKLSALAQSTVSYANSYFSSSKFINTGKQVCAGLAEGILQGKSRVINAMAEVARDTIREANEEFKVESPSRVMMQTGMFVDLGLAKGIVKYASYVLSAVDDLSDDTINAFSKSVDTIRDYASSDDMFDFNPVISPELDLSNLLEGSKNIANIFNQGYTTSLAVDNGSMFARRELETGSKVEGSNGSTVTNNTYNFNQTNNSPEALSRIDIYRSTKNQFAQFKEAVGNT